MQMAITSVCDFTVKLSYLFKTRFINVFIFFDRCSPHLFLDLSAATRVEYMLVVLADVMATADKRSPRYTTASTSRQTP